MPIEPDVPHKGTTADDEHNDLLGFMLISGV